MSISKQYLLEQIKRSRAVDLDENRIYVNTDKSSDNLFWYNHNIGHIQLLTEFKKYITTKNNYTKKDLLKFLKIERKIAKEVTKKLDKKYNDFKNNEEMTNEDTMKYAYYDGVECKVYSLIQIMNGKLYYDKDSYISTDWVALGLMKEE